ncbi:response regulator [Reyranella sp.]|jgi:DNA-binding response OmpR family regulator|uniref:response regulator n=1 Tax=Reyranella sp. TaxID=1929291 RepID=UPI002F931807
MKEATPAGEPGAARATILVVEDEPLLRMAVCDSLHDAGFAAIGAADSSEAIRILHENDSVALVFSDINLPGGMNGDELAVLIRHGYPAIKILLTSGRSARVDPDFPFLAKPFFFHEMRRRIEALLGLATPLRA